MFGELLAALFIALVLVALFSFGFGRPGPWGGFLWFFLVVFLGAWAIGLWAEPVGPAAWGVAWVPILFGALLLALLIAAIPPTGTAPAAAPEPDVGTAAVVGALGVFFWALLVGLLLAILLAFLF